MNNRDGFTLVELLAVIIVIGLVMTLGIPAIMNSLNESKKKGFIEYISKVYQTGLTMYIEQSSGYSLPDKACTATYDGPCYVKKDSIGDYKEYFYEIQSDLNLTNTGDFKGFISFVAKDGEDDPEEVEVYIGLYNNDYITSTAVPDSEGDRGYTHKYYIDYSKYGEPSTKEILSYSESRAKNLEARYKKTTSGPLGISEFLNDKIPNK